MPANQYTDRDFSTCSEHLLLRALLNDNEEAWRAFIERYDGQVRAQILAAISPSLHGQLDSDALDDMMGDFYVRILTDHKARLRSYADSSRTASLATWLTLIAVQSANRRLRRLIRIATIHEAAFAAGVPLGDAPDRGARWLAVERQDGQPRRAKAVVRAAGKR